MLKTASSTGGGGGGASRTQLVADKTLYVRTPAHAVTFTNASANVVWATHGLSVNDPVVLSIVPNMGAATVTIASPGVFTKVGHGYVAGQPLRTDTTGALPTGLTAGGTVYVIAAGLTADNFEVSLTPGGAAINTSGSQSGTHYISQVGAMPTFSTAGLLVAGAVYYVKTVVDSNTITLSTTAGGTALGTATVATGSPIYSASTGNDANDGSAADRAHARLTLNETAEYAYKNYDLSGDIAVALTIQLADSVYPPAYLAEMLGWTIDTNSRPSARILGNAAYPSNVLVALGSSDIYGIYGHGQWDIDGVGIDISSGSDYANGIVTYADAYFWINSVYVKGRATQGAFSPYDQTQLYFPYSDAASAANTVYVTGAWQQLVYNNSGKINFFPAAVTLLNTPSGTDSFIFQYGGQTVFLPSAIAGTWSGAKMDLQLHGQLETGGVGVTAIPGSTNGTIQRGSWLDGNEGATATNDDPLAGTVGEFISSYVASGAPVSLSNNTPANVTSISLTAGDWDVEGNINFAGTAATITAGMGGIDATSATVPTDGSEVHDGTLTTVATDVSGITLPRKRISIATTTTVYLVAQKTFSAGAVAAYGGITARRVR